LPMAQETGNVGLVLNTLFELAICYLGLDNCEKADEVCRKGLALALGRGYRMMVAAFVHEFGSVAQHNGRPKRAARLFGAARGVGLRHAGSSSGTTIDPPADLSTQLGLDAAAVAEEWGKGRSMSTDEAVELALSACV